MCQLSFQTNRSHAANTYYHSLKKAYKLENREAPQLSPPEPYTSWLEYAVACPDVTCRAQSDLFDCASEISRDDIRQSIVREYVAVCELAGINVPPQTIRDLLDFRTPNFNRKGQKT